MDESNMDVVEGILTRERAVEGGLNPMGHKFYIEHPPGTHLMKCACKDGRVKIPDELAGSWTSRRMLEDEIRNYLNKMWDMNDAVVLKNSRGKAGVKERDAA